MWVLGDGFVPLGTGTTVDARGGGFGEDVTFKVKSICSWSSHGSPAHFPGWREVPHMEKTAQVMHSEGLDGQ